jgi:hypothetical protein
MARKVEHVTIESEGRDKGKEFILTEMPALAAERWATQALSLLANAGLQLPEGASDAGMAGLAAVTIRGLPALKALQDPSIESWLDCVQYQHSPNMMPQKIFQGMACQIEEIATVNFLRMKVLEVHIGPFAEGSPSNTGSPSPTRTIRS